MDENPKSLGGTAIKPPGWDRTGLESLRYFIYDPDTGSFLSRTPASWAKIILFYTVYYTCLTLFWIACLQIFFTTLPEGRPKWLLDGSLIGSNPGVGVRPGMPLKRVDSSLYKIKAGSEDTTPSNEDGEGDKNIDYSVRMRHFLERYDNKSGAVDCTNEPNRVRGEGEEYCRFDMSMLEECGEFPYGYVVDYPNNNVIHPCFILKLNKIYDWSPEPVRPEDIDNPEYEEMTSQLKARIRNAEDPESLKNLWIDCRGRYPADREVLEIEYYPRDQGIPLKYFPYRGGHYNPPLVAIKVTQKGVNEAVNYGQLMHVECRAWYHGVIHDTKHKSGLVQFDLMFEPAH